MPGLREGSAPEVSVPSIQSGDLVPLPIAGLAVPDFSCGIMPTFRNDEGFFVVITCKDRADQYKIYSDLYSRNYKVQMFPDRREKRGKAARLKEK